MPRKVEKKPEPPAVIEMVFAFFQGRTPPGKSERLQVELTRDRQAAAEIRPDDCTSDSDCACE
jgi:hypothetical protein